MIYNNQHVNLKIIQMEIIHHTFLNIRRWYRTFIQFEGIGTEDCW